MLECTLVVKFLICKNAKKEADGMALSTCMCLINLDIDSPEVQEAMQHAEHVCRVFSFFPNINFIGQSHCVV